MVFDYRSLPPHPLSGRGGHITAAAQDEGGNGQDGPPEAVGEPGADRAGGALGGQAGQPAPGGCGLPDWASLASTRSL